MQQEEELPEEKEPGYDEGYEAGLQAAAKQYEDKIAQMQGEINTRIGGLPEAVEQYLQALEEQAREEICQCSFQIAECLVKLEENRKSLLASAVREVLDPLMNYKGLEIRFHPDDMHLIKSEGFPLPEAIHVSADPSLNPGDIIVTSDQGLFDGSLSVRIGMLADTLKNRTRGESE